MKKTYKVKGMHCTSCAMVIEGELEDAGIQGTCSYIKETLEVDDAVTREAISAVISKEGYSLAS